MPATRLLANGVLPGVAGDDGGALAGEGTPVHSVAQSRFDGDTSDVALTVGSVTTNHSALSAFDSPRATSTGTSRSRGVNCSSSAAGLS